MQPGAVIARTVDQLATWIDLRTRENLQLDDAAERMGISRRTGERFEARWKEKTMTAPTSPARITLKAARERTGLSIGSVARLLEVSKATVHARENGERGLPAGELDRYAEIYDVPAAALIVPVRQPPDLEDPETRGKLAQRMVPLAVEFAGVVRDEDHEGIGRFLAALAPWEWQAFTIALAAMVPDDRSDCDLLAWVTWDSPSRFPGIADRPALRVVA